MAFCDLFGLCPPVFVSILFSALILGKPRNLRKSSNLTFGSPYRDYFFFDIEWTTPLGVNQSDLDEEKPYTVNKHVVCQNGENVLVYIDNIHLVSTIFSRHIFFMSQSRFQIKDVSR